MLTSDHVPHIVKMKVREMLSDGEVDEAVIVATAINAWPGAERETRESHVHTNRTAPALVSKHEKVILPLQKQEGGE